MWIWVFRLNPGTDQALRRKPNNLIRNSGCGPFDTGNGCGLLLREGRGLLPLLGGVGGPYVRRGKNALFSVFLRNFCHPSSRVLSGFDFEYTGHPAARF